MKAMLHGALGVLQLAVGLLGALMLAGLLPGDGFDVNTVGALVVSALAALAYLGLRSLRTCLRA